MPIINIRQTVNDIAVRKHVRNLRETEELKKNQLHEAREIFSTGRQKV